MGSWGFDVNRSTNEQTLPHNTSNEQQIDKDQDTSTIPQIFKLRTPTLTRHRNRNEFSAVDRLALGPKRMTHTDQPNQQKIQAEQELLAWQNRLLDRFVNRSSCLSFVFNFNILFRNQRPNISSSRASTRQIRSYFDQNFSSLTFFFQPHPCSRFLQCQIRPTINTKL